ncbi:hypothetical protein DL766_006156 [Monosporascus sp. MC13-8B]|uniref:Clr5 domain-containing protein n=1 Tax=Monosporascus cannonballus TaxID=155416 RepID=A0ABY0HB97_9PEZI|nr:hypothetical protein DL762_003323 [Monosporascus cannonballus]RYP00551.1 hypothetical protein DL763_000748 [Monosporascus cannonballus]RYP27912.1 hypothetical protein DL766_006156 [Monosporascus sp. MC13-8B]
MHSPWRTIKPVVTVTDSEYALIQDLLDRSPSGLPETDNTQRGANIAGYRHVVQSISPLAAASQGTDNTSGVSTWESQSAHHQLPKPFQKAIQAVRYKDSPSLLISLRQITMIAEDELHDAIASMPRSTFTELLRSLDSFTVSKDADPTYGAHIAPDMFTMLNVESTIDDWGVRKLSVRLLQRMSKLLLVPRRLRQLEHLRLSTRPCKFRFGLNKVRDHAEDLTRILRKTGPPLRLFLRTHLEGHISSEMLLCHFMIAFARTGSLRFIGSRILEDFFAIGAEGLNLDNSPPMSMAWKKAGMPSKVPASTAVEMVWGKMTGPPYNIQPTFKDYGILIKNLLGRGQLERAIPYLREARRLYDAWCHEFGESVFEYIQTLHDGADATRALHRHECARFAKKTAWYDMQTWCRRLLLASRPLPPRTSGTRAGARPQDFGQRLPHERGIPAFVREFRDFVPNPALYRTPSGYVRLTDPAAPFTRSVFVRRMPLDVPMLARRPLEGGGDHYH